MTHGIVVGWMGLLSMKFPWLEEGGIGHHSTDMAFLGIVASLFDYSHIGTNDPSPLKSIHSIPRVDFPHPLLRLLKFLDLLAASDTEPRPDA
jgi:hypothetical protein